MKQTDATKASNTPASRPAENDPRESADPELQGEGNYEAARRHRNSLERFLDEDKVESAAEAAAPKDAKEERDMKAAENIGLSHGRH